MAKIDINCDLGESFGAYTLGRDGEVLPFITSANIACGYHAGDAVVMDETVRLAAERGVSVGAHPGYPDLAGFGRRNMDVTPAEVKAYVIYQTGALMAFCAANGVKLRHVKPHGAMYNMAAKNHALARAIAEGIYSVDRSLILLGLSGSLMLAAAEEAGLRSASEVFADRAYEDDGSLVARSKPGAVITDGDEAAARAVRMAREGKVTSINGRDVSLRADSICVHGDGERALEFVTKINRRLAAEGIEITPLDRIV